MYILRNLDKLVKEDDITYSVIGKYEDIVYKRVYPFSIHSGINIQKLTPIWAKDI